MSSIFGVSSGVPFDPNYPLWAVGSVAKLWDGDGWTVESMSWKAGCYIHGGLSGPGQIRYYGKDVVKFLERIFVNNFSRFKVGTAKHAIACNEEGLIVGHGVLQRLGDEEFRIFVHGLWAPYQFSRTNLSVHQEIQNNYLFQIAGPRSRKILSAVAGEDVGDVAFLRYRNITVAGRTCEIMRVGMAGTLAYELHGPIAEGPDIYRAVLKAGESEGIVQLGWKTYQVNHVEGGFPQQIWTFLPATLEDPDFLRFAATAPSYRVGPQKPFLCGSVAATDRRARYRTPLEVGWGRSVVLERDFIGKDALAKEMANPKRTIVTLEWDSEDVQEVQASYFREGPIYKRFEYPVTPEFVGMIGHADHVQKNGINVGIASGVVYSLYFRRILSHCTIDIEQARIGNQVSVLWGDHGGPLKEIRATVARYPYLAGDNRSPAAGN